MTTAQDPLKPLLTLLQLERRAREAQTLEGLGFVMVNETRQLLHYRQAALWSGGLLGRVHAVSGLPQTDSNTPYTQWLAQLCRQVEKSGQALNTHTLAPQQVDAAMATDWAQWLPSQLLWLPLRHGALLLARDALWTPAEQQLAQELAHAYAHAQAALGPRQSWADQLRGWLKPSPRRRKLLLGIGVALLFPVHLTVLAPAEVTPQQPFIVRAPLEGVVDQIHIKPNQMVTKDSLLVSLDSAALKTRYDVARQAQATAEEEFRQAAQAAVTDADSSLDMALKQGALEARALELGFTSEQLDRIQIKAPTAGVAVFADANDWVGKAVAMGERIMLLADPAELELTIQLPAADAINLKPGALIKLYPNGSPLKAYTATLHSIAYRAEPTEHQVLAYRVKARFAQGETLPRLGTQGTAKLYGAWVPLVYYALRRPLTAARQWLGW
ncbi:MAG TPA: HlyD family efflux transporter periplasmic adaptor subunit [Pseudomonas sp.]|nr:HlyD family efflux transporter periplasmic adaptor subunit [Pseudomonas sp.]